MTFKNTKEEVIELQLTSYGKRLLSLGKLHPYYYSFHDDDITYDMRWSLAMPDATNYAHTRIIEETPRMRNQVYMFGVETEVERQIESRRSQNSISVDDLANDYIISSPMARSALYSDYSPSWDLSIYGARFQSYEAIQTISSDKVINIPRVKIEQTEFKTYVTSAAPEVRGYSDLDVAIVTYNNGNSIAFDSSEFIIEVDEEHTIPLSKNYDIEVYLIEEIYNGDKQVIETTSKRLNFMKEMSSIQIVDDILVEVEQEVQAGAFDSNYVEYYLNIKFDEEIEKQLLCELGYRTDYSKRGHIPVSCGDERELQGDSVYDSDTPKPPFGDDC